MEAGAIVCPLVVAITDGSRPLGSMYIKAAYS